MSYAPSMPPLLRRAVLRSSAAILLPIGMLVLQDGATQPLARGRYAVAEYARIEDPAQSLIVRRINALQQVAAGLAAVSGRAASLQASILTGLGPIPLPYPNTGGPARDFSASYGLNDMGEAVGAFNAATALRPFRTTLRGTPVPLPVLRDDTGGVAYGINLLGEAVGYSSGASGMRAVWWNRAGAIQALPALSGTASRALGVNDRGDVVGVSGERPQRAVLWPGKGQAIDLGTLPGFSDSEALSINLQGDVVGNALGVDGAPQRSRAVLWNGLNRQIQDLGTLPGDTDSRANEINARGEVVGASSGPHGDRAFLWTARDGMVDLNSLVSLPSGSLVEALGINNNGAIVAVAQDIRVHANDAEDHGDHGDHELPRRVVVLKPR